MRFEIRHVFDAPREKVEQTLFGDADYMKFLLENHDVLLELETKERVESDSEIRRKVRYRPKPVIKSIGPKTVPPEWFAFTEESVWNKGSHSGTFHNIPTTGKVAKMMLNKGTITIKDMGGGKTERVIAGDLKLDLPFLIKMLAPIGEAIIHSEAVKLLDGEAAVMRRWLADHK